MSFAIRLRENLDKQLNHHRAIITALINDGNGTTQDNNYQSILNLQNQSELQNELQECIKLMAEQLKKFRK